MRSILHEMFKIVSVSGALPQTPLRSLSYDAPLDPLVGRGFLPSAIASSRLRRMQFPRLTCLYAKNSKISPAQSPPPWRLQHLDFFTFKISHYLKSLKICPASPCAKFEFLVLSYLMRTQAK